jgi:hypothetical protein
MKRFHNICFVLLLLSTFAKAQFRYERKITKVTSDDWYSVPLYESILTKLNSSFSDIRIYSSDGTETPFLVRTSHDETSLQEVGLETYNVSKKENDLYFTVKLAHQEAINHATFNFAEDNYDTYVTMEGSNDEKDWFAMDRKQRIISVADNHIRYTSNTIYWPPAHFVYLRFKVAAAQSLTLASVNFSLKSKKAGVFRMVNHPINSITKNKITELKTVFNSTEYVSKLTIEVEPNQKYYRSYQIETLTDSFKTEKGWQPNYTTLQSGVISSFKQDTILIEPILCSNLRVLIFNEDNPPIKVKSITTWSPEVSLVANLKKGSYTIKYTSDKIGMASYDVTHFENEIPTNLPKLAVGEETVLIASENHVEQAWFKNKNWLWAIMLGIVGLLGFFTVRMMRKV